MKKLIIALFLLNSVCALSQINADYYLELAAENNPELKASYNEYLSAMERIPQVQSLPDPQVSLGIFLRSVETRVGPQRASLALSQSFPWFGTLKAQGDVAAIMAEAKLIQYDDLRSRISRDISSSLTGIYFIEKSISIMRENLNLLEKFQELARVNFENDRTGLASLLELDMEEKELMAKLELLLEDRIVAKKELENIIHHELSEPLDIPDSLQLSELSIEASNLSDSLYRNNLKIQTLQRQQLARKRQIEVVGLARKPSFTLGASYINVGPRTDMSVAENGKDAFLLPQVGMRIPLFQKKYQAMIDEYELDVEAYQYKVESEQDQLDTQIRQLIKKHRDANRRLKLYTDLTDLSERSLSLMETQFSTDNGNLYELIRMERKLLGYRLEKEKALVDNNNTMYQINYLLGR